MDTTWIETDKSFLSEKNFQDNELVDKCVEVVKPLLLERPEIIVFGKVCHQNRNVGFFSNTSIGYKYSGKLMKSQELPEYLSCLLEEVNRIYGAEFNGILVNRYMNGNDYIGGHSDDESGLDRVGVVCLSVGEKRKFRIRDKRTGKIVKDIPTQSYHLLHMGGDFQSEFTHEIPVQKKIKGERISFTFRKHSI